MSYIETAFVGVKDIRVEEPITRLNRDLGKLFTVQSITIVMESGEAQEIRMHLATGAPSLIAVPIITNDQATA